MSKKQKRGLAFMGACPDSQASQGRSLLAQVFGHLDSIGVHQPPIPRQAKDFGERGQ